MTVPTLEPRNPPVAIILVNWNGWRDVAECVDTLLEQTHTNYHVFVVDNASTDDSVAKLLQWSRSPRRDGPALDVDGVEYATKRANGLRQIPIRLALSGPGPLPGAPSDCPVTLVRSERNLGFAAGCNAGIRAAGLERFELFWLLNPDTVVHRDALTELVRRTSSDPRIGMIGSTIRYYETPSVVQALGGARMNLATVTSRLIGEGCGIGAIPADPGHVEREMVYVMGASMLVSRRFIEEIGLLQEDYFLYYEEIDWAMRGRESFKLAYAPASHVFHKSGASSSKAMPLYTANLYYRNRLRFVNRFMPERLRAAKRGLAIDLLRHTLKGRWGHVRIVAGALWDADATAWRPAAPGAVDER